CELLLSALTVSAVSLSVSPNLQQFFSGSSSVSLSCVDGWTVRRTRGGLTEDCGAAGGFGKVNSSSCVLDLSVSSDGSYFCVNPSGQQSDGVSITVSDKGVILEIPALPVRTGSDVTLRCKPKDGSRPKSYFFRDGGELGPGPEGEWILSNVQKSDEGLYKCCTDIHPSSPQSRLRVKDPPPPTTTTSPPLPLSTLSSSSSSLPLYLLVLPVVLALVGGVVLWRKHRVPPSESVLRLFCHLVVFCPYCISTGLLWSICCSMKTPNKPAVSMGTAQHGGGGQGLEEEYNDVTADVITEHAF
ncbi:uncharacterized protein LOC115777217, partial [Archocentrus centrarchus]|uniref:uncharacterized protein LOC115777217 n=1 Tax=Archocentrus centrarchus TaxID=63155 RepID=UPI0011EA362C